MLRYAIEYRSELAIEWLSSIGRTQNKYLICCGYNGFNFEVKEDDYHELQMVSLKHGRILGYFSCSFDRTCRKAYEIIAVNFLGEKNLSFARDMFSFLDGIFVKYGMNKVEWSVTIGNPAEAQYDRIIKRYGGKVIGIRHETCSLVDGTRCDMKLYELMRRDYMPRRRLAAADAGKGD